MIEKIAVFWGEDWEGLYINGKLVYENHNIRADEIITILDQHGLEATCIEVDDAWLMEKGRLPKDAANVVVCNQERAG